MGSTTIPHSQLLTHATGPQRTGSSSHRRAEGEAPALQVHALRLAADTCRLASCSQVCVAPTGSGGPKGPGGGENFSKALIAGAFVLGIGVGVWFNSEATLAPSNVASTEIIDRKTPNTEVCMANGFSSMVFDQRLFVSFNPCAPLPTAVHACLKGSD